MWIKLNDLKSSFVNFSQVYEVQNIEYGVIGLFVVGGGINKYIYKDIESANIDYDIIIRMLEGK